MSDTGFFDDGIPPERFSYNPHWGQWRIQNTRFRYAFQQPEPSRKPMRITRWLKTALIVVAVFVIACFR